MLKKQYRHQVAHMERFRSRVDTKIHFPLFAEKHGHLAPALLLHETPFLESRGDISYGHASHYRKNRPLRQGLTRIPLPPTVYQSELLFTTVPLDLSFTGARFLKRRKHFEIFKHYRSADLSVVGSPLRTIMLF